MSGSELGSRPRSGAATVLGSISGNLFLVIGTLFWGSLATLFGWLPPRGRFVYWCSRQWARGVLLFSGVRPRASFEAPLDPDTRYVYMANHQSLFDIPLLLATLPAQTRFMAKKSLFQIPVFGWALSVGGFIPVDRRDRSTARQSFSLALKGLDEGASVLLFPEEERSPDGEMLPFRRGGFLLALKRGVAIVPIGIRGAFELRQRDSFAIHPGPAEIRYGRPFETASYSVGRRDELMADVVAEVARLAGRRAPAA